MPGEELHPPVAAAIKNLAGDRQKSRTHRHVNSPAGEMRSQCGAHSGCTFSEISWHVELPGTQMITGALGGELALLRGKRAELDTKQVWHVRAYITLLYYTLE